MILGTIEEEMDVVCTKPYWGPKIQAKDTEVGGKGCYGAIECNLGLIQEIGSVLRTRIYITRPWFHKGG